MAQVNDAFSLQVTSELMLKLTKDNSLAKQPVQGKRPTQRAVGPQHSGKPLETPKAVNQDLALPYYPGFLSSLPGLDKEQTNDLVPIYKVLEESENLGKKLQQQEEKDLEKVKQLAQELQDKQFRAPSNPVPCQTEKERCLQCYRDTSKSPLECAETVRVFRECSQRVHQDFTQRTAASQ